MKENREKRDKKRCAVALFFGGKSNEREISVITGIFCANLLRGAGYSVLPVCLTESGMVYAKGARTVEPFAEGDAFPAVALAGGYLVRAGNPKKRIAKIDVALNCCHGGAGEDGTLAALLAWNGIPSASPDAAVCAVFMDKSLTKLLARGLDIPVARSETVREGLQSPEEMSAAAERLGYPLIVKPLLLGSSIGVSVVRDGEELAEALALAFTLDRGALLEEYFPLRREFSCAAYAREGRVILSEIEEVFSRGPLFTFGEKYEEGTRPPQIPADLPASRAEELRSALLRLYETLALRGVIRADFLLVGEGAEERLLLTEVNAVPGSLACPLFGRSLSEARNLLCALVEEGRRKIPEKTVLSAGILRKGRFAGAKGCKRGNFPL